MRAVWRRVSAAEAGRRIRLVATAIHGGAPAVLAAPAQLAAVAYSREAHMRLLQSQADAARLEASAARMEDGGELTAQQLVGFRQWRTAELAGGRQPGRTALRELSEMKGDRAAHRQIAEAIRRLKLQSELVVKRQNWRLTLTSHNDEKAGGGRSCCSRRWMLHVPLL